MNDELSVDNNKQPANIKVGNTVKLIALPPYIKTADPMPMLKSPDLLNVGDRGIIIDRRPGGYYGVRFDNGAFLLDNQYLELIA
jgi:hypothetical protein